MENDPSVRFRSRPVPQATLSGQPKFADIRVVVEDPAKLKAAARRSRQHTRAKRQLLKASQEQHGRSKAIGHHPTVEPIGYIGFLSDRLGDTSSPSEIILDPFYGTGSTLLACERTGRVERGLELDPKHVDTAVRRLQQETAREAVHLETGMTFAELGCARHLQAEQPGSVGREDRS